MVGGDGVMGRWVDEHILYNWILFYRTYLVSFEEVEVWYVKVGVGNVKVGVGNVKVGVGNVKVGVGNVKVGLGNVKYLTFDFSVKAIATTKP